MLKTENSFMDKEVVQQILVNAAHVALLKEGDTEFDCSISKSCGTEPQGKVEIDEETSGNKEVS